MTLTTTKPNFYEMWDQLTEELSQILDTHGVCIALAQQLAQFTDTAVLIGLAEPNNCYYDVWLQTPDGNLKQDRWIEPRDYLNQKISQGQIVTLRKHNQQPSDLIDNPLWHLPNEKITLIPLPYPRIANNDMLTDGIVIFIDPGPEIADHPEILSSSAMLLTTYLERSALRYQRDRQRIEFTITSEISQSLTSTLKLEDIFAQVSDDIRRILNVESLSLGLIDRDTPNIVFIPTLMGSMFIDIPPLELKPGQGVAGWVAVNKKPLIVNDAYRDRRFSNTSDSASGFQTRSILCVPLQQDGRVIGIMEAINKRNGEFTQHDQELLEALSGPLTAAILNAELHTNVVEEKRRIETIFQSMSEGAMTTDHDGRITAINDSMLALLGQPRTEMLDKLAYDYIHLRDDNLVGFLEDVLQYDVTDSTADYPQLACEIKQGNVYVPVLASGTHLSDKEGNLQEIILVFSDLRQIREVERMRDDFFHAIVHELRTPLALILMYSRLLQKGNNDEEKKARFLQTIERESDRLQTMVRQMLQLAKLEAKEIQRSSGEVNLNSVLNEIIEPLADKALEKGLTFIQKIEPDLPPIVADRETIYMICKNLIDNAVKFTLKGAVRVSALTTAEQKIQVKISDDGIGIPSESLQYLFRRFYRAQTAVERGIAGTGLGLHMVKEGVEKHKGSIDVDSKEGEGTTFTIHFPISSYFAEQFGASPR